MPHVWDDYALQWTELPPAEEYDSSTTSTESDTIHWVPSDDLECLAWIYGHTPSATIQAAAKPPAKEEKSLKGMEDKVQKVLDGFSEDEKAIAYFYLYSQDWRIEKVKTILDRLKNTL